MTERNSLNDLHQRLMQDPTKRAEFLVGLKDLLKQHGVSDIDLNGLSEAGTDGDDQFFVSAVDGKKNKTTVYFP